MLQAEVLTGVRKVILSVVLGVTGYLLKICAIGELFSILSLY